MGNVSSHWDLLLNSKQGPGAGGTDGRGGQAGRAGAADDPKGVNQEARSQTRAAPPFTLQDPVARFDNLAGQDIEALWRTFVAQQESFAVTREDLIKLMAVLKDAVGGSDPTKSHEECTKATDALFKYWTTYNNDEATQSKYVDMMEIIMAFLFTAKMPIEDKVNFLFDCMDFDGDDDLDFEELAISIKSVEGGLAKLRQMKPSTHQKVLELVREWFPSLAASPQTNRISRAHFAKFCLREDGVAYRIFQLYAEAEGEAGLDMEEDLALRGRFEKPEGGGDEFMAIKPWLGAIKHPPSAYVNKTPDSSAPDSFLLLDWIHGYTVEGAYNNVRYVPGRDKYVVYNAAAVGVVSSVAEQRQWFFLEHTDDVISLAVGSVPSRPTTARQQAAMMPLVATGELGKKPKIEVWSPPSYPASEDESPRPLFSFDGLHQRGVCCLAFSSSLTSSSGKDAEADADPHLLVSVGLDDDHTVGVYSVDPSEKNKKKGLLVCSAKGSKQRVLCTQWNPYFSRQQGANRVHFVTCGAKSVDFWTIDMQSAKLKTQKAVFNSAKVVTFLAVAFLPDDGNAVVGTSTGSLYLFQGKQVPDHSKAGGKQPDPVRAAHDGPVLSLSNHPGLKGGSLPVIVSAGKDGKVVVWSARSAADFSPLATVDVMGGRAGDVSERGIRSAQLRDDGAALLVGTCAGDVLQLDLGSAEQLVRTGPDNNATKTNFQSRALTASHFKGEVWGLAVHPDAKSGGPRLYCTVGDDCTLRLWDIHSHRQVHLHLLQGPARACAWSPDGKLLAVGYGTGATGKERQKVEGTLEVFEFVCDRSGNGPPCYSFASKHVAKDAKEWISDVKFTPDGKSLAAGSHDNCIYLYSVFQTFKRRAKFSKHNSYITHFDFSADSRFMQSNCGAYELLFSNVQTAQHITDPKEVKDVQWATWTCILGWPVQGIWPPCADGTDINAVDRTPDGRVLATGDDFGRVKLFRYPSAAKQAESNVSIGHSSHVTCVRWAPPPPEQRGDDPTQYLISTGGNDKCVFQWRHRSSSDNDAGGRSSSSRRPAGSAGHVDESLAPKTKVARPGAEVNSNDPDELVALEDGGGGGDEFMATKPWLGAIVTPSAPQKLEAVRWELDSQLKSVLKRQGSLRRQVDDENKKQGSSDDFLKRLQADGLRVNELVCQAMRGESDKAPDDDGLTLEWIHGYRCDDCRNNVRYDEAGTVVYHAAAMGVMLTVDEQGGRHRQRFNLVHSDDIISFAMHPNQRVVATGQVGAKPKIQVWEVSSKAVRATLQGFHVRGVSLLTFSSDGDLLLSVGQDDDHSIAIYEWATGTLRGSTKGGRDNVLAVDFVPSPASTDFLSCGVNHVKVWTRQGQNLAARQLKGGGGDAPANKGGKKAAAAGGAAGIAYTVIAWLGEDAVIGNSAGHVYLVALKGQSGGSSKDPKLPEPSAARPSCPNAHDGAVFAACNNPERTQVLTGGKDGRVIAWAAAGSGGGMAAQWVVDLSGTTEAPKTGGFSIPVMCLGGDPCFRSANPAIRSVQAKPTDPTRLLIGTQGSELIEVRVKAGAAAQVMHQGALVTGHYKDEIWGLAVHPSKREYITAGDDHTLRKWDVPSRRQVGLVDLGGMTRACTYSPDGSLIAVGMGGSVGRGRQKVDGTVKLLDNSGPKMEELHKTCDAKEWISEVKFTPDGKTLAAGSHDNAIYLYAITPERKLKLRAKFAKHNSYITHFDFSADSHYMQSNCGAYELLFSNVQTANMMRANEMKDVPWSTWTCILGWPVQGIWPPCSNGTDINSVDRSHVGTLLATGDDFGKVKLFRYPCVQKSAQFQEYLGHSAHVTAVRWTAYDECLISTGGGDKCVFQWYNSVADDGGYSLTSAAGDSGATHASGSGASAVKAEGAGGGGKKAAAGGHKSGSEEARLRQQQQPSQQHEDDSLSEAHIHLDMGEEAGGGDEFMAVKPWLGAIKAPTRAEDGSELTGAAASSVTRAPQTDLQLEWIYGYAGHSYRSNLFYTATQDVVYPAAAVGVVMAVDRRAGKKGGEEAQQQAQQGSAAVKISGAASEGAGLRHKQSFFRGHEKDIVSMAICPHRRFVATGDVVKVGRQPSIQIWDSSSCTAVATLPPFHKRGICALSFSQYGEEEGGEALLASVGLDDEHTVAVWKDSGGAWSKVTRQAVGKGDNNAVCFALWARSPNGGNGDDVYPLVTGGAKHIRFWKVSGTTLASKKGVFGKIKQPSLLLCGANFCMNGEWRVATGASTGEVLVWSGRDCVLSRPAHEKAVQCMAGVGSGEELSRLVTGGREGKVKVWNWALESIHEYDVSSFRHCVEPSLRAVDVVSGRTTQAAKQLNIRSLLVGTGGGEVFEIQTDQRQFDSATPPLVHGHFLDETWGLDAPCSSLAALQGMVVTSGDDGTVRMWDVEAHAMLGRYLLPKRRAAAAAAAPTAAGKVGGNKAGKKAEAEGSRADEQGGGEQGDDEEGAAAGGKGAGGEAGSAPTAERQMSRAVAWEPSLGQLILVGLGGDTGRSKAARVGGHLVIRVERERAGGRWEVRDRSQQPFPMFVSRLEREWVSDVKWCPRASSPSVDTDEGGHVFLRYATGSHDNYIRIFGVWSHEDTGLDPRPDDDGPPPAPTYLLRLQGHNSYITHLDFSIWEEGKQYLQSNCGAYELLFWDVTPQRGADGDGGDVAGSSSKKKPADASPQKNKKGAAPAASGGKKAPDDSKAAAAAASSPEALVARAAMVKASSTRNATWSTWSCTLGWPVQGIWSGTMDGTDVNAVCRLESTDQQLRLAVAGDDGKVKIYKYPCVATNAEFVEGSAHSSHVTNVRYAVPTRGGDTRLFTTGGNDKCLMQWRVVPL